MCVPLRALISACLATETRAAHVAKHINADAQATREDISRMARILEIVTIRILRLVEEPVQRRVVHSYVPWCTHHAQNVTTLVVEAALSEC